MVRMGKEQALKYQHYINHCIRTRIEVQTVYKDRDSVDDLSPFSTIIFKILNAPILGGRMIGTVV